MEWNVGLVVEGTACTRRDVEGFEEQGRGASAGGEEITATFIFWCM